MHIAQVLASKESSPHTPLKEIYNPIANSQLVKKSSRQLVDQLLSDYSALIEPTYAKWFAYRFYRLDADMVRKAASEAKADGNDPKRLFSFLISKYAQSTKLPAQET